MGDPVRIARVRDRLSEPLNNAEPTIGLGEQHDPAIGTDPPAVKSGGDLLAADGWKAERQKVIVGHGGRGLPRSQQRVGFQQPNPTPDQKLTLLPPPPIRPRHEYDGLESDPAADNSGSVNSDPMFIAYRLAITNLMTAYAYLIDEGRW